MLSRCRQSQKSCLIVLSYLECPFSQLAKLCSSYDGPIYSEQTLNSYIIALNKHLLFWSYKRAGMARAIPISKNHSCLTWRQTIKLPGSSIRVIEADVPCSSHQVILNYEIENFLSSENANPHGVRRISRKHSQVPRYQHID